MARKKLKGKLVGKIITDVLSGRKGIVIERNEKHKDVWVCRFFVAEQANWVSMDCPRKQFMIGEQRQSKIGF